MGGSTDEFPLLSALGLYAAEIRGDGNCLFNALSDQLYGHQKEHHAIRAKVIAYMREHASYYKQFIDVYPGGGLRRNPKRKNAGTYSTPVNLTPPTPEEIERVFESHLQSMAKGGTYGDNMEISAFSSAYDVDVKIYQRDFAYMVSGGGGEKQRDVAHIAYHTWEHYSSIRNLDGPHTGLPHVRVKALSPEEEHKQKEKLAQTPYVMPWMIDVVSKSLPFLADKVTIKRALEESKGNIDAAVSKLLDVEDRGSVSSAQESSSVEREADSDDDAIYGPNKKQDRRMSRASKATMKDREQRRRHLASRLAINDSSQQSIASADSHNVEAAPNGMNPKSLEVGDTDDEDWEPISVKDEDSPSAPNSPRKAPTRLKINPPKHPHSSLTPGGRTQQRQAGPQHRRGPTAREKKDMKKQAQKAARKERAQAALTTTAANGEAKKIGLPILTKEHAFAPGIESGIKTLYI